MADTNKGNASTVQLTSTTAPGKTFSSRSELANHYKSDWHKYNLKRREMSMDMLTYEAFHARLEAALAMRKEREIMQERSGKDHLKDKKNDKKKKKNKKNSTNKKNKIGSEGHKLSKRHLRQEERNGIVTAVTPENNETDDMEEENDNGNDNDNDTTLIDKPMDDDNNDAPPVIDPKQSLFDNKVFPDVQSNVDYMYEKYGFFIPDVEYLVDLEGLIGYCAEKIKLGHTCLWSQKTFSTWQGCQKHMIQSRHTKLRYEAGIDLEEFDVFYDFKKADAEFLNSGIGNYKKKQSKKKKMQEQSGDKEKVDDDMVSSKMDALAIDDDDDDPGEWEDIDSDEEMEDEKDDGLYAAYQDEIAQHGLDITPLGELIFPDGRIIGHRGLSRYYKQRIIPEDSRTSVVAARRARGELLHEGRVYDTHTLAQSEGQGRETSMELVKAGLSIGATRGRAGNGILVPANGSTSGGRAGTSYTALSLYRYKATIAKAKREEFKALRLQQRTTLPMNRMDKKWNRLHNNVSVAHALR